MTPRLDHAEFLELHRRVCAGDGRAWEELTHRVVAWLVTITDQHLPRRYAEPVYDGVVNTWLKFRAHPEAFDPHGAASLETFLLKAGYRKLQDFIKRERRFAHRQRQSAEEKKLEICVALDPSAACIAMEDQNQDANALDEILAALNDTDRAIVQLRLSGVPWAKAVARILGIEHWPIIQLRAEVRRQQNRINRWLKRNGLVP